MSVSIIVIDFLVSFILFFQIPLINTNRQISILFYSSFSSSPSFSFSFFTTAFVLGDGSWFILQKFGSGRSEFAIDECV